MDWHRKRVRAKRVVVVSSKWEFVGMSAEWFVLISVWAACPAPSRVKMQVLLWTWFGLARTLRKAEPGCEKKGKGKKARSQGVYPADLAGRSKTCHISWHSALWGLTSWPEKWKQIKTIQKCLPSYVFQHVPTISLPTLPFLCHWPAATRSWPLRPGVHKGSKGLVSKAPHAEGNKTM